MVQSEIIEYLEENKGDLFSARQIAEAIDSSLVLVHRAIIKLLKYQEIDSYEADRIESAEILGVKSRARRQRFYFIQVALA